VSLAGRAAPRRILAPMKAVVSLATAAFAFGFVNTRPVAACSVSPYPPPPGMPVALPEGAAPPPLEVFDVRIERGFGQGCGALNSCAGTGKILFRIRPSSGTYSTCSFAYAIELAAGALPEGLLLPPRIGAGCVGDMLSGGMYFTWDDGAQNEQDPFAFELRLMALDAAGEVGPATTARFAHDGSPRMASAGCDAGVSPSVSSEGMGRSDSGCAVAGSHPRAMWPLSLALVAIIVRRRSYRAG
jgi:hypothetical protein